MRPSTERAPALESVLQPKKKKGLRTCGKCRALKPLAEFSMCKPSYLSTRLARCNTCKQEAQLEEEEQNASCVASVVKKQRLS